MTRLPINFRTALLLASLVLVVVSTSGCLNEGKAQLTTVFTGDGTALANKILSVMKAEVPVEDIESLTVTVTRIVLDRGANEAEDGEDVEEPAEEAEEESTEKDDNAEQVEVFSGEMRVNILDLTGVSQLVSLQEVPAGHYSKIRLEIADPELVLKAEPETVYTNIHLTANDRLFITTDFDLEDGTNRVLVLDFGGIHLVPLGNGDYNLTPQLRASLEILSVENTFVQGVINAIDYDANTLVLGVEGGEIAVTYAEDTEIFLSTDDAETPTGAETDLLAGIEVICYGELYSDNTMTAARIELVPEQTEELEPPAEE
ncbi:MAG TPA: DUF4382 domain-containing protein [Candidatus Hydrogenedentes bacterium]|nr:DUF4382 domain-containing protein [Candidatus Hydrogenedentota bacterium]HQM49719.1 DUF4382 domain-containing protein [Candidatus Hydrogenedentota bacterium]